MAKCKEVKTSVGLGLSYLNNRRRQISGEDLVQGHSLLYQKLHVTIDCAFRAYSFPVYSLRTEEEISSGRWARNM